MASYSDPCSTNRFLFELSYLIWFDSVAISIGFSPSSVVGPVSDLDTELSDQFANCHTQSFHSSDPFPIGAMSHAPPGRILIVCTANKCRSPVGEAVLRRILVDFGYSDWEVRSAGLWAHDGDIASQHSVTILAEEGVNIRNHLARRVTCDMVRASDLIICMQEWHVEELQRECATDEERIICITSLDANCQGIPDPIGRSLETYRAMIAELSRVLHGAAHSIIDVVNQRRISRR